MFLSLVSFGSNPFINSMSQPTKPNLLAIGYNGCHASSTVLDIYTASTLREAIATIRLICIDLLLVGLDDPRLDVWNFIERVLAACPDLRWLLISERATAADEIQARSLGALMMLHELPEEAWLADFAASLRQRDLSKHLRTLLATNALEPTRESAMMPELRS
jgi:hypothetical protein